MFNKMRHTGKSQTSFILKVLWFLFLFVIFGYALGVLCFWGRFPFRTTVNGISVTGRSPTDITLDRMMETKYTQLCLLRKYGVKELVPFERMGVYRESDNAFVNIKLESWKWPLSLLEDTDYELTNTWFYNREKLANAINNMYCVSSDGIVDPKDAYVKKEEGRFIVVEEKDGTRLDTDRLFQVICEHLDNGDLFIDLEAENCYKVPDIKSDDELLLTTVHDGNELLKTQIDIVLDGKVHEVLPFDVLSEAVYQDGSNFRIRSDVIQNYVFSLAEKYNTVGMTRKFDTSTGAILTLSPQINNTFIGYELNQVELTNRILNAITAGENTSILAPWFSKGKKLLNKRSDIGDTYIELNIERQHLWFYENGRLIVQTDVTTGTDNEERRTPTGLFYVMNLYRDYTMYYSDGSSPCDYFIKVTSDGVGIHDASWRSEYGGDIWKTNGSHGCINTPYDAVQLIFQHLSDMDDNHIPVIIY